MEKNYLIQALKDGRFIIFKNGNRIPNAVFFTRAKAEEFIKSREESAPGVLPRPAQEKALRDVGISDPVAAEKEVHVKQFKSPSGALRFAVIIDGKPDSVFETAAAACAHGAVMLGSGIEQRKKFVAEIFAAAFEFGLRDDADTACRRFAELTGTDYATAIQKLIKENPRLREVK